MEFDSKTTLTLLGSLGGLFTLAYKEPDAYVDLIGKHIMKVSFFFIFAGIMIEILPLITLSQVKPYLVDTKLVAATDAVNQVSNIGFWMLIIAASLMPASLVFDHVAETGRRHAKQKREQNKT